MTQIDAHYFFLYLYALGLSTSTFMVSSTYILDFVISSHWVKINVKHVSKYYVLFQKTIDNGKAQP
jgi:hypothetical protein